jgi:hypothetical protein
MSSSRLVEAAPLTCGACRHYVPDPEVGGECHLNPPVVMHHKGDVFCARPFPSPEAQACSHFTPRLNS